MLPLRVQGPLQKTLQQAVKVSLAQVGCLESIAYQQLFKTPEAASACLASGMNTKKPAVVGDEQAVTITTDVNNPSTSELTNFVSRASKDGMWITDPLSAYDAQDERLRADEGS